MSTTRSISCSMTSTMSTTAPVRVKLVSLVRFLLSLPCSRSLNVLFRIVTYIWDIRDLTAPKLTGLYRSSVYGIDHNQYVRTIGVYRHVGRLMNVYRSRTESHTNPTMVQAFACSTSAAFRRTRRVLACMKLGQ